MRRFDTACIERLGQILSDPLFVHTAMMVVRKLGKALQEELHLGLELEAPGGVAFQGLAEDRGGRLVCRARRSFCSGSQRGG